MSALQQDSCINELTAPMITIVTATYNAESFLPELIHSIREQTYPHIEWIVIDAASKDGTIEILRENEDIIAFYSSEPDNGIYDAWNKGVRRARGEWIYFLGADDFLWEKNTISHIASRLGELPSHVTVAYARIMLVNEAGDEISSVGIAWEPIREKFKQVMCIPHQGVFHRRALFEKNGEFDASFRIAGDYELLLRELKNADAVFMPEIVAGMRQGGISNKPENTIKALQEIRRAQKMHGFKRPGTIWMFAYMRSYLRTWAWNILGPRYTSRILDFYRRVMRLPAYWTKL